MHIKKWTREAAEAKDEGWIGTCDLCERHIDTHVWHCAATDGPWERGHWLCETCAADDAKVRRRCRQTADAYQKDEDWWRQQAKVPITRED